MLPWTGLSYRSQTWSHLCCSRCWCWPYINSMKPSQASPASVCFAGVTSPSDSVVCLWIKLLARQYTHSFHIPTSPSNSSPIQLGLFVALSGLGLVLRFVDFSAFNGLFHISHSPMPQQHLFNFLCGAIRAALSVAPLEQFEMKSCLPYKHTCDMHVLSLKGNTKMICSAHICGQ